MALGTFAKGLLVGTVLAAGFLTQAQAQDLVIGTRSTPSVDPHFMFVETNVGFFAHVFGSLTTTDEQSQLVPDLAESWDLVDDTTWEFKLRQGVTFHDGSAFDAEDVVFSFERVPLVPNNPSPYSALLEVVDHLEVVDPHTVRIRTRTPWPFLPVDMASIAIVSNEIPADTTTADFESGAAAIGTGPYRIVEHLPGERLVLQRSDSYWGEAPAWERVTFRIIPDDAARMAALLSGAVDLIDYVPPADVPRLREEEAIALHIGPSNRTMFLSMDRYSDMGSPFAVDSGGAPLSANPFADIRVRRALSLAINRDLLAERVMDGLAIPASQYVVPGFLGHVDTLGVDAFDPDTARALLAEAGYPDGFGLTLHCTNDRYINDALVCQAVAQMLAQVGLAMQVETMPVSMFFERARGPILGGSMQAEFSLMMWGWGASGGEADVLWGGLMTPNLDTGDGTWNLGAYSNTETDALIDKGRNTLDRDARGDLLRQAMALLVEDYALIPLYYQTVVVASRDGIVYRPRVDERTVAMSAKPAE